MITRFIKACIAKFRTRDILREKMAEFEAQQPSESERISNKYREYERTNSFAIYRPGESFPVPNPHFDPERLIAEREQLRQEHLALIKRNRERGLQAHGGLGPGIRNLTGSIL